MAGEEETVSKSITVWMLGSFVAGMIVSSLLWPSVQRYIEIRERRALVEQFGCRTANGEWTMDTRQCATSGRYE